MRSVQENKPPQALFRMTEPSPKSGRTHLFLTPSLIRALVLYASLLFLLLVMGHVFVDGDFKVFYTANRQLFHRLNPYNPQLYSDGYPFGLPNSPLAFLIAAPASFFRLSLAIPIWDVLSLMLWAASVYLWMMMLWRPPVRFEDVARVSAACAIPPLYWAFASHQMIFQVLLCATIACWITQRKGSAFWAGVAAGGMLMKPHLVALLALALFAKSNRKFLFSLGMAIALLLPFIPFMHTLRPPSDLLDWSHTLHQFRSQVFYADEQGLGARAISTVRATLAGHDILRTGIAPGVLIPASTGNKLFRGKVMLWLLGAAAWSFWGYKNQERSTEEYLAITLGWSLLLSVYSHLYDALLLVPLVLVALREASKKWPLSDVFGIFFAVHFVATWLSLSMAYFPTLKWQVDGWAATAYFAASLMTLYCVRCGTVTRQE